MSCQLKTVYKRCRDSSSLSGSINIKLRIITHASEKASAFLLCHGVEIRCADIHSRKCKLLCDGKKTVLVYNRNKRLSF